MSDNQTPMPENSPFPQGAPQPKPFPASSGKNKTPIFIGIGFYLVLVVFFASSLNSKESAQWSGVALFFSIIFICTFLIIAKKMPQEMTEQPQKPKTMTAIESEMAIMRIQQQLSPAQQSLFQQQYMSHKKNAPVTFILALLLPGTDRMYLGQVGLGLLKLLLAETLVWTLIDLFNTRERTSQKNMMIAQEIALLVRNMVQ